MGSQKRRSSRPKVKDRWKTNGSTEELKIHIEKEGIKLMQHTDEIDKMILQTTENRSDICEALQKGTNNFIHSTSRIHLKYVTLIKDQHNIEEEKQWIYHL